MLFLSLFFNVFFVVKFFDLNSDRQYSEQKISSCFNSKNVILDLVNSNVDQLNYQKIIHFLNENEIEYKTKGKKITIISHYFIFKFDHDGNLLNVYPLK